MRRIGKSRGDGAVETMLVTSVVVLAIVSSAYAFVPSFAEGVKVLGSDVQQVLQTGTVAGLRNPLVDSDIDGGVTPRQNSWWEDFLAWWGEGSA